MVTCPSCGTENADGMKFCVKCGTALAPAPGSWRAPSGDLSSQPSAGVSNAPGGYTPPSYAPPAPGALYNQPAGVAAPYGQTMNYAQWIDRVLAALIDGALNVAIMIVLFIVFGALAGIGAGIGGSESALPGGIFCFGTFIAMLSVFIFGLFNKVYLVSKRGFSIGQGIIHLKVVDAAGNIPPLGTLILRLLVQVGLAAVPLINWILVLLDALWPLWDEKRQTLHDKAVGTFVIKTT